MGSEGGGRAVYCIQFIIKACVNSSDYKSQGSPLLFWHSLHLNSNKVFKHNLPSLNYLSKFKFKSIVSLNQ